MRIRGPQDLAAGLALVVLALFALWATSDLDAGTLRAMGPAMLPRATAVLLGTCGLVLVVLGFVKRGEPAAAPTWRAPLFIVLAVVGFALTIRSVGLVVAGPLVAIVSGGASPETRPKELVVFAIVMTAFCVGLFRYALGLPIPILILPGVTI
ncbi:MAG TPA: tripartite tricarboxylate transporter TctB family protein [Anaeromyxobacteraceae bacterium]|nr:tripartite tricarboxylate transporter TctB family protein [Anaeromyxobacteraceae bacterium]